MIELIAFICKHEASRGALWKTAQQDATIAFWGTIWRGWKWTWRVWLSGIVFSKLSLSSFQIFLGQESTLSLVEFFFYGILLSRRFKGLCLRRKAPRSHNIPWSWQAALEQARVRIKGRTGTALEITSAWRVWPRCWLTGTGSGRGPRGPTAHSQRSCKRMSWSTHTTGNWTWRYGQPLYRFGDRVIILFHQFGHDDDVMKTIVCFWFFTILIGESAQPKGSIRWFSYWC